jgi:hypothetical protein
MPRLLLFVRYDYKHPKQYTYQYLTVFLDGDCWNGIGARLVIIGRPGIFEVV